MSDAMQIARQRIKDHESAIAAKESEIEDLREQIGDLERFLEFGQDLIGGGNAPQAGKPQQVTPQQSQPQQQPQIKEVRPQSSDDVDDEWATDAEKNIEAVLAARKA